MAAKTLEDFLGAHAALIDWLYARSEPGRWQLPRVQFAEALHRSATHRFKDRPPESAELTAYLNSLQVADLALACACAEGSEPAWEHFFRHHREDLYAAARAIIGSAGPDGMHEARARELADSLYAELYGLADSAASRRSLFRYFHGRSKLSTWLRAILAQRHVDSLRASRRFDSLEEESETADRRGLYGPPRKADPDPNRAHYLSLLQDSLLKALGSLAPRDLLRLSSYYARDLTLAQIGRLLSEHEATVSRHLDRIRRELRRQVESALRDVHRLSQAQIELCFEYALDDWPHDLSPALSGRLHERAQE